MMPEQDTDAGAAQAAAALERQLAAALAERDELLRQQAASAEILKVINASSGDLTPVFDIILEKAHSLCDVTSGSLQLFDGDHFRAVAVRGMTEAFEKALRRGFPVTHRIRRAVPVQNADLVEVLLRMPHEESIRAAVDLGGIRTNLLIPLVKDGVVFGRIVAARREVRPFTEKQIALLQAFADQAVIAIENARLLNETKEALERQTATADILKVIASSPSDVQPAFEAIAASANRLIGGFSTAVFKIVDDVLHLSAFTRTNPAADAAMRTRFPSPLSARPWGEQIRRGEIVCIPDTETEGVVPPDVRDSARRRGFRSMLQVPLLRDQRPIGLISVTRVEPGPFAARHVQLLQTFADQAVIAVENVRLFNETKQALERQTATAEILKVIAGSPDDVQPVLDTVADRAMSLLNCWSVLVGLFDGEQMQFGAARGALPDTEAYLRKLFPARPDRETNQGRCILERTAINVADLQADANPRNRERARLHGFRAGLVVPMLRDGQPIGTISVSRREAGAFAANEVELLQTFADQAVIAIENTRLFNETKEALERQTATADILKVIASSPDDVQPVFEAIAERSNRIVNGLSTAVYSLVDDVQHLMAFTHTSPEGDAALKSMFPRPLSALNWGEAIRKGETVRVPDIEDESAGPPSLREVARTRGWRSALLVPLLRDQRPIGLISVTRAEPGPFTEHHVQLLRTFADQAVIAIQNARLFNETREALEQQTATADILKVIASSPEDVQPVFQAIAERSNRLVSGLSTTVLSIAGETVSLSAFTRTNPAADAFLEASFPRKLSEQAFGETVRNGEIYRLPDTEAEPSLRDLARLRGYRSMLFVPLLHNGVPIGMIGQTRAEPGPFAENHVQLLKTFADQAVIAISNVRLFQEVQERTRELSASLDDLRTAQDRLVQTEKLASLGQLTAGIAHEIKNPLNFVNNFSALSAELVDELAEALAPAALDQKTRGDVSELTHMLKSNLEKVVQHGKRADSIVKNMLLHSREGSGEHRPADINAIVDESLNLAYHGARAERPGFNIALKRELDPEAGMVELYPQEITRVLLNLISNGFYAATKRKEAGDANFEPMLSATTKGFGSKVEIRIRDNGAGIPLEVKEKMFNPFFTTKPAGEGTGLGLSMSHDIVVKQHGGKIDVDTEPGVFTEFIITLPRTTAAQTNTGGPN